MILWKVKHVVRFFAAQIILPLLVVSVADAGERRPITECGMAGRNAGCDCAN